MQYIRAKKNKKKCEGMVMTGSRIFFIIPDLDSHGRVYYLFFSLSYIPGNLFTLLLIQVVFFRSPIDGFF